MKKIVLFLFCLMALTAQAQTVTKTTHKKAVKTDVVTTGTVTIRKPDYICISTDNDKDQLIMDGTQFTMTMGKRKHVTIPTSEELTILTKGGQKIVTITPDGKKKRQLFTSFVLSVDAKTSAFRTLRMNGRGEDYTEYTFSGK